MTDENITDKCKEVGFKILEIFDQENLNTYEVLNIIGNLASSLIISGSESIEQSDEILESVISLIRESHSLNRYQNRSLLSSKEESDA